MALPTSNLLLSSICDYLAVSTPKSIFYNGGVLKSIEAISELIEKNGLNPSYCPGSTPDARLANLLSQRKLSYFKGYQNRYMTTTPSTVSISYGEESTGTSIIETNISGQPWEIISVPSFATVDVTSGSAGSTQITITSTSENPNPSPRYGNIVISTIIGNYTIIVEQRAYGS